ncbi:hypothetical protein DPM19_17765 [Actinomadura craniellae]|uniref:DUF3592 domain-containing protein n=1 Tax=Actinomadura craniellae TaxID=2231787 RepID=A0A365H4Z0_9ACTN|nr:DUF3592 domain-containing protein [Actinomadura craniellae]RAY14119.1 hypothetical protein DPM19_17765 [Actinomadura craniellae]
MHWVEVAVPAAFVLTGALMVVLATRTLIRNNAFTARAVRVPGVVVGGRRERGPIRDSMGTYHFPTVRYRTLEGAELERTSPAGRGGYRFREGADVTVMYEPADPGRFVVREMHTAEMVTAIIMTVFGIFLGLFGLLFTVSALL